MRVRLSGSTITAHGDNLGSPYVEFPGNEPLGFSTDWTVSGSAPNRKLLDPHGHEYSVELPTQTAPAPGGGSGVTVDNGTVSVANATSILLTHGSVSDAGGGVAEIDTGIIVTPNGSIDGSTIPGYIIIEGAAGGDGSKGGQIYAQDGSTGQGGVASVHGGLGGAGLNGGGVLIGAGTGDDGDGGGGATVLLAGGPSSGVGGAISISGGNANFGGGHAGGGVSITGGAGDGAGPRGSILITGLPTADPNIANALYTDGVPSAGVPKALMVSGG